jgi:predicted Zn-dependent protease
MSYSADYRLRFKSADHLRKQGDTIGAIKILRDLISDFPKNPAAYLIVGDIFWDQGELSKASTAFRVATKHFPTLEIASLGLFHTLWQQSRTNAAFEEMKRFQTTSFSLDYKEIVDEILENA